METNCNLQQLGGAVRCFRDTEVEVKKTLRDTGFWGKWWDVGYLDRVKRDIE